MRAATVKVVFILSGGLGLVWFEVVVLVGVEVEVVRVC